MNTDINDLINEITAAASKEGGTTPSFFTGERSDCSRKRIEVGGGGLFYHEILSSLIDSEALKLRVDITWEYDGCDVFSGDCTFNVLESYPLDSFEFSWTSKQLQRTRPPLFPETECCRRAKCLEVTPRILMKSGISVFRLIGIGGDSVFERKFVICGDNFWQQIAPA